MYNFPDSPTPGEVYTPPFGGQSYIWQPPHWLVMGIPPNGSSGVGFEEAPVDGQLYGRQNAAWSVVVAAVYDWDDIGSKPTTFPPSAHGHPFTEITGNIVDAQHGSLAGGTHHAAATTTVNGFMAAADKVKVDGLGTTYAPLVHTHSYSSLTGIPATFAPSAHSHPQSEVTGLVSDLALKAPLVSPAFTGTPTAPTPTAGDNDTSIATTAFVTASVQTAGAVGGSTYDTTIIDSDELDGFDSGAGRPKFRWPWSVVKEAARAFVAASANVFSAKQLFTGPVTGGSIAALSNAGLEVQPSSGAGGPAAIAFHRPGAFAAYFGLEVDNTWRVGGWSMGATSYVLLHNGNWTSYINIPANVGAAGHDTVGSYIYAKLTAGTSTPGGGAAGSNLTPTGHDASGDMYSTGTGLSGSWRCMGNSNGAGRATLWLRYA